jgi:polysaccharide deacetylase family protein (PEP-CTERM system associated)
MSILQSFSTIRAVAPRTDGTRQPWRADPAHACPEAQIILSFDVEEHFRIEAAAGLDIDSDLKAHYARRMEASTHWLLELLADKNIQATFFVVGQVAQHNPRLVRAIHAAGHEVASHSWEHQRIHHLTPKTFRDDVRHSKHALEQATGAAVTGFRAPTFSIVRRTGWAIDILAEEGMGYDSSIFPVWHDRYGIPRAPRGPFLARGLTHSLLEFPPATLRLLGANLPVGGGGYFRLLPLFVLNRALRQVRNFEPAVATLYFHPWEFDPDQPRLPLKCLNGLRTYIGLGNARAKLEQLLTGYKFTTARRLAATLGKASSLASYRVAV